MNDSVFESVEDRIADASAWIDAMSHYMDLVYDEMQNDACDKVQVMSAVYMTAKMLGECSAQLAEADAILCGVAPKHAK